MTNFLHYHPWNFVSHALALTALFPLKVLITTRVLSSLGALPELNSLGGGHQDVHFPGLEFGWPLQDLPGERGNNSGLALSPPLHFLMCFAIFLHVLDGRSRCIW